MKTLFAAAASTLCLCDAAEANQITKTVPAGQTSTVYTYMPSGRACKSVSGVVTLVSKPQHGRVSHHSISTTFGHYQYDRMGAPGRCHGKPTTGFVVTYTPMPGFRGVDHFTLDVKLPEKNQHQLDGFAIIVE